MRDAFGTDGCVLVLGATSDIAAATVRELAASGTRAMTLTARQTADLAPLVDELSEQGVACRTIELDVAATATVGPTLDDLFADADYDLVLCAIGVLDDDERHLRIRMPPTRPSPERLRVLRSPCSLPPGASGPRGMERSQRSRAWQPFDRGPESPSTAVPRPDWTSSPEV